MPNNPGMPVDYKQIVW